MNDSKEVQDGLTVFERAIARGEERGLLGPLREPFDTWHAENGILFAASIGTYAACLSENGDDLSQWRAYCPHGGYSLGLDGGVLSRRLQRRGTGELVKVVYDSAVKDAIADLVVAEAGEMWSETQTAAPTSRLRLCKALAEELENLVLTCVACFKDEAFSAEAEWRILASGDLSAPGAVKYRAGRSSVVPYVALPLFRRRDRVVKRAIVGPCPDPELTHAGMGECLADADFEHVGEVRSSVPYRSW
jgi:hypothetical protein